MAEMRVSQIADLTTLKYKRELSHVVLETGTLKRSNLLRHALKYGFWALAPGGRLEIEDDGPVRFDTRPGQLPFSLVRQQVFKLLGGQMALEELDEAKCRIVLRKISRPLPMGFGAGVVFSGKPGEVSALRHALSGLRAQPELARAQGGQIMVCGPAAAQALIEDEPDIDYLPFENPPGVRAMTPRKKNALIEALPQPRLVILHARIVLATGCLAALPAEFDAITPRVEYHEAGKRVPYLDWNKLPVLDADSLPRSLALPIDFDRGLYLQHMSKPGQAAIDGGLFIVRRDLAQAIPLDDNLAWGEAEDIEWCSRLHAAGALVDLAPEALALSQSYKLPRRYIDYPRLTRIGQPVMQIFRRLRA